MTTVAVTGAAGFLGRAVLEHLDADDRITRIVGFDVTEPQLPVAKLEFRGTDLRDALLPLALEGVDVVVHAGFGADPVRSGDAMFAENVNAARNLLAAARKVGARKVVLVSSASVYGAHADNPIPLREDAPLRANADHPWAYQRQLVEELVVGWGESDPSATVTVLRPATVLGAGADHHVCRLLEQLRLLQVRGYEPPLQFVDVDDLAAAVRLAVGTDLPGAYNVAADGWLPAGEVTALLHRRTVAVPEQTAFTVVDLLWRRGLYPLPPGGLHYLMHPWVVSAERLHAAGWSATRSNREVLRDFAAATHGMVALGSLRVRRRDVALAGALGVAGLGLGLLVGGRRRRSS